MMKYFLLFMALFLAFCGLLSKCYHPKLPEAFIKLVDQQKNPFLVPNDSSALVWKRAFDYLESRKGLIVGGKLRVNDTVIFMPYYNSYRKGSSVRIERHPLGDSTLFRIQWWYSRDSSLHGSKEIALYMQHGIERYSFKK